MWHGKLRQCYEYLYATPSPQLLHLIVVCVCLKTLGSLFIKSMRVHCWIICDSWEELSWYQHAIPEPDIQRIAQYNQEGNPQVVTKAPVGASSPQEWPQHYIELLYTQGVPSSNFLGWPPWKHSLTCFTGWGCQGVFFEQKRGDTEIVSIKRLSSESPNLHVVVKVKPLPVLLRYFTKQRQRGKPWIQSIATHEIFFRLPLGTPVPKRAQGKQRR